MGIGDWGLGGDRPEWGWWILSGILVALCLAATIISAGGFSAGGVAIYSAMCGIAYGSAATTVSSFMFVGTATIFAGAICYNAINIATAGLRETSYQGAFDEFLNMGEEVFVATLFGGIIGGIGGLISYDDQLRGLGHSWTTERRKFFKKNPSISSSMVLHHPYGRRGANIRFYYPITVEEHRMIHQKLGYGRGNGGFYQYREWINWWIELIRRF